MNSFSCIFLTPELLVAGEGKEKKVPVMFLVSSMEQKITPARCLPAFHCSLHKGTISLQTYVLTDFLAWLPAETRLAES